MVLLVEPEKLKERMSISLSNAISAIEVLTDTTGAPHFKRADLGSYLKIADIKTTYRGIAITSRLELSELQGQNDHDVFVDLEGALGSTWPHNVAG